ncbi:MAG TPA: hypothetical protein VMU32_05735 [Solirubrobacteraceae bacterium]|nr:hypothetical protein [Solirubrobacteraceae bacterium]
MSTVVARKAVPLRRPRADGLRWLAGLVAVVGAGNAIVLLAQARDLVHGLYLNADNAAAFVLPALAGQAPKGAVVNLGNHPWYEPWWLMRATVGLPHYRALWEAAPFVFTLLAMAIIALGATWALGRMAGLLSAVALIAGSETLRGILLVPESHGALMLHTALLCGGLLVVHRALMSARRPLLVEILVGAPLAIVTAAGATDQLLLFGGVAPFALAPLLCWLRTHSRVWREVSIFAVVVAVVSVVGASVLSNAMQEQGVIHAPFPIDFATTEALFTNLGNTLGAFAALGGGAFFGQPASGSTFFTAVSGLLILTALGAVLHVLWRRLRAGEVTAADELRAVGRRELFTAYWALVLVVVLLSFALTSVGGGGIGNSRYVIAGWGALAALLGVLAGSRRSTAIVLAGVAAFAALNMRAELASGVQPAGLGPSQRLAGEIERFALAHGARIGYSGYWEAAPLTWETRLELEVRPVGPCPAPADICTFSGNYISSWYRATPGIRTFLVVDASGVPDEIWAPPAKLGHPLAAMVFAGGYSVYVFNHDLAANLSTQ